MNKFEKLKEDFEQRGEVIAEWAEREGFNKRNVYAVISGRNRGIRGESHEIAIRLGLKPDMKYKKRKGGKMKKTK